MAAGEAGFDGTILPQRVLKEAIQRDSRTDSNIIPNPKELERYDWTAFEVRDMPDLPDINVLFTGPKEQYLPITKTIVATMRQYVELFGLNTRELKPIKIYLDPEVKEYRKALAFYNYSEGILRVCLDGVGLDHELAHWVELGIFKTEDIPQSHILREGFAAWLAWFGKDEGLKRLGANGSENYHYQMQNAIRRKNEVSGPPTLAILENVTRKLLGKSPVPTGFTLDGKYPNRLSEDAGGYLFEILYEKANQDPKKLFDWWRTANQYPKVSEWITACGLDKAQIEAEWNKRIFSPEEK